MACPRSPLERIVGWREVELERGISTGLALVPEIQPLARSEPWASEEKAIRLPR
jgi:hypothetical protein